MRSNWIYLVLIIFLSACDKAGAPDCFKKTGTDVTETRVLPPFRELILYSYMDLELTQDSTYRIELTGGKNLLSKIETRVVDNQLEIENNNNCGFVRGYKRQIKLKLFAPNVRIIRNKGVGDIRILENWIQDSLDVFTDAVGDVYVSGFYNGLVLSSGSHGDIHTDAKCDKCYIYVNASNYVYAEQLRSKDVTVIQNGLGDCHLGLSSTDRFEYQINNSGNIYYVGDPQQIVNSGKNESEGKLIRK